MIASTDDFDRVGRDYLARLSEADLAALVRSGNAASGIDTAAGLRVLRREPALILDVLDRPATSAAVLNLAGNRAEPTFTFISPFLLFAAVIHRTAADLAHTSYALERAANTVRVPVFDTAQLTAYLAAPRRRLFLADLLVTFARVSNGVAVIRTPQGVRRRRWSDLDPSALAALLDSAPDSQRAQICRRLGDLALFLAGVFPDAAGRILTGRFDRSRLARRTGLPTPSPDLAPVEMFEWLGPRWYRIATTGSTAQPLHDPLPDTADDFHLARRVLNTATDRYLFPSTTDWFGIR